MKNMSKGRRNNGTKKIIGGITGSETIMSENKEELMTIYNYMDFFLNTEINNRKK